MRNDHDRLAVLVASHPQQGEHLHARPSIEIAGGFVCQHDRRLSNQCSGQRHSLLLPPVN
jgi:hypothetical protein